jgi:hypothetical protein
MPFWRWHHRLSATQASIMPYTACRGWDGTPRRPPYGRAWELEPDEPQEAFLGRVAGEAKSIRANCSVVVFLDTP